MTDKPEKSGGTVRLRGTHDGKRVDVYHAVCETCGCHGPASVNSQRGARAAALELGWECEKVRVRRSLMETFVWSVRCKEHRKKPLPSA